MQLGLFKKSLFSQTLICLILFSTLSLLISSRKSFWRDEAFSFLAAHQSVADIIATAREDFAPPGYYLLLQPFLLITQNPVLLRIVSLVPVLFILGISLRLASRSQSSYWPVALLATQPLLLYFSVELRAYSWLMLFAFVSTLSLSRLHTGAKRYAASFALANLGFLYLHNLGIVFLIAQTLAYGLFILWHRRWRLLPQYLILLSLIGLGYSPWLPTLITQTQTQQDTFWVYFDPTSSWREFKGMFVFNEGLKHNPLWYDWLARLQIFLLLGLAAMISVSRWNSAQSSFFTRLKKATNHHIDYRSTYTVFALVLGFTMMGFYSYSWLISPILYGRYVSFLAPLVIFFCFASLISLNRLHKAFGLMVILGLLLSQCLVVNDFLKGLSPTKYRELALITTLPIYTDSVLDTTPCIFYNPHCYFIGDPSQAPSYVGLSQLKNIPRLDHWSQIQAQQFYLLSRDADSLPKDLNLSHQITIAQDLGDGVQLQLVSARDDNRD